MWLLRLIAAFRTSRVLDDRKMGRASREQAMVHALLQQRACAPLDEAPDGLRRAIARRIENAAPSPAQTRMTLAARAIVFGSPVLVVGLGAAMLLQTRVASTPSGLPPVVSRPFSPIVAVNLQDDAGSRASEDTRSFAHGEIDEGLLTSGPLASMRRPVPGWMRDLPGAPVDATRTVLTSTQTQADPMLLEARRFELRSRFAAQSLMRSLSSPRRPEQAKQED